MKDNKEYRQGYVDCHNGYKNAIDNACKKFNNSGAIIDSIIKYLHIEDQVVKYMKGSKLQSKWQRLVTSLKNI